MPISSGPSRLPLTQLRFGSIDAKNEVQTRDPRTIRHFRESFLEPSGLSIDEFLNGQRFYVYGMKGAGKTALLRYIHLLAKEKSALTRFITFAPDISEAERERIYKDSQIQIYEQKDTDPGASAVSMWLVFIVRQLVRLIEEHPKDFEDNQHTRIFCELIKKTYEGEEKGILQWLSSALKNGQYTIKTKWGEASLSGKDGKLEGEYTLDVVIDQCLSLLRDVKLNSTKGVYIFFDELNLSFASIAQHKRDAVLIRDLIIAVDKLNSFFIENDKPIQVLVAARSEVLNAIRVPTHEINKILTDRGRELRWFSRAAADDWPITRLFEKKVRASEVVGLYPETKDVFREYFLKDVFGLSPKSLIVELTWCNPRDLILLFGKAASGANGEKYFGEALLKRALEEYSAAAWIEKTEELSVEYAPAELQALKKLLMNFRKYFKIHQFEIVAKNRAETDSAINQLIGKRNLTKALEDLYRVGVIGQSSREPTDGGRSIKNFTEHWAYRGENNFDPNAWMVVHRALWVELRLGRLVSGAFVTEPATIPDEFSRKRPNRR